MTRAHCAFGGTPQVSPTSSAGGVALKRLPLLAVRVSRLLRPREPSRDAREVNDRSDLPDGARESADLPDGARESTDLPDGARDT